MKTEGAETQTGSQTLQDLVSEPVIQSILKEAEAASPSTVQAVIRNALEFRGLTTVESATLLTHGNDPAILNQILAAARRVKEAIYGRRLVFFAPLYITNVCANNCLYCAYRRDNRDLPRRTLTAPEVAAQVKALEDVGHKRLLLVAGDNQRFESVIEALATIYATRSGQGEIRRVNVNIAPPSVEQFRQLKAVGIGTYQCFQETYHRSTYQCMHPDGTKADFDWRLEVMDRALEAGVDDVSTGVLLGLYDYRYDVTALIQHGHYLDRRYGVGPHAVSVPRLRVAKGTPLCDDAALASHPHLISDDQFRLVVGVLRLALPYAGLILTTRETPAMRQELIQAGVSQISAGSHTEVGGYQEGQERDHGQFEIEDTRSLDDVLKDALAAGSLPSFCTACYRTGRTGKTIMDLLKPGTIQQYCLPNALLTLKEYLEDYASEETRRLGEVFLADQVERLPANLKPEVQSRLARISQGKRDLYY